MKKRLERPDLRRMVEEAEAELRRLPPEEQEKIQQRIAKRKQREGGWRMFIPVYGIRHFPTGIDSHWTTSKLFLYQATAPALTL